MSALRRLGKWLTTFLFAALLLGGGPSLLGWGIVLVKDTAAFIDTAATARGVLTNTVSEGVFSDTAEVWFRAADERDVTFESNVPAGWRPDQEVGVYYDPARPDDARVQALWLMWFWPVLVTALGALASLRPAAALVRGIAKLEGPSVTTVGDYRGVMDPYYMWAWALNYEMWVLMGYLRREGFER